MTDEIRVTVLRGRGDWEAVYVDGEMAYENHLDRSWPTPFLDLIENKTVTNTRTISDDDIHEHVPDDEYSTNPRDEEEIWEYPDELPDELA